MTGIRDQFLPPECRTPLLEMPSHRLVHVPPHPPSAAPIDGPVQGDTGRLLDRVRGAIAARHYSPRTERAYLGWIRRYLAFGGGRPVEAMGAAEVTKFLSVLAVRHKVSASTQNQALSSLLFLYRNVLGRKLEGLDAIRAKPSVRLPIVLSRTEVVALFQHLHGIPWLMSSLMYGAGLRLLECARLRIKDLDFGRGEITVRDGKGRKDRVTILPEKLGPPLTAHLERVRRCHDRDRGGSAGHVALPDALERKYPSASSDWAWQWVFPATRVYVHGPTGKRRRHHLHESVLQRAFKDAVRAAGITKPATCHTLRHYPERRIIPRRFAVDTVAAAALWVGGTADAG